MLAADTERAALLAEAETATDPHRIAEIQTRLADIDAHSAEARAASILAGLGFDEAAQRRPCSSFSGGWRMRVALAAVLFAEPDLLLLDEPTNYLDLEGTLWLENYLARYPHTVLIISHDRDLLNKRRRRDPPSRPGQAHRSIAAATTSSSASGASSRRCSSSSSKKQDDERAHLQAFVDRFRAKASKATQAQSRAEAAGEDGADRGASSTKTVMPFAFPDPQSRCRRRSSTMDDVAVGYEPGKPVLRRLNLRIDDDDRIGLLGANGNGKSTFAKLIAGRLDADGGRLDAPASWQSPISPSTSSTSSSRRNRPTTTSAR